MNIRRDSVHSKLAEIHASPVEGRIYDNTWSTLYTVTLPHILPFTAEHEEGDDENEAFLNFIQVPETLRNNGIATRMLGSLAYMLVDNGYDELVTTVDSPYTVMMYRTLFGEENVSFNDYLPSDDIRHPLPMTADQAIASISDFDRGWSFQDCEDRELSFGLNVDLSKVDVGKFEPPLLHTYTQ